MAEDKRVQYPGRDATVTWQGDLCIHIGECGRAKGDLFVGGRKPWCEPDVSDDDEIKDVVLRCPTGALSVEMSDGTNPEAACPENTIHVAYNGPLYVRGELEIEDAPPNISGLAYRAALCRCGQSKNKPYCDNGHEAARFKDYGAVGDSGEPTTDSGGPLVVKGAKDGPLLIKGNLSITSGSGRTAWHGTRAALCRCGASANKPFCDGAHTKIGFRSDD